MKRLREPPKRARVTDVQFGIYSEEEIERLSVVEVNQVRIHKSGIVHKHGINDSAMGTNTRAMLCSTCGGDMNTCPERICENSAASTMRTCRPR